MSNCIFIYTHWLLNKERVDLIWCPLFFCCSPYCICIVIAKGSKPNTNKKKWDFKGVADTYPDSLITWRVAFKDVKKVFDVPVMKGRKWYSLKKDLQLFITRTSNYCNLARLYIYFTLQTKRWKQILSKYNSRYTKYTPKINPIPNTQQR